MTIAPDATVQELLRLRDEDRSAPVFDGSRLVGIVARHDIIRMRGL